MSPMRRLDPTRLEHKSNRRFKRAGGPSWLCLRAAYGSRRLLLREEAGVRPERCFSFGPGARPALARMAARQREREPGALAGRRGSGWVVVAYIRISL